MSVSTIIGQQCAFIEEQGVSLTTEQLKRYLDTIVKEMKKNHLTSDGSTIIKVLTSIHKYISKSCGEPVIVDHQLFTISRDYYIEILRRWRDGQVLDKFSGKAFLQISKSLDRICAHVTDANVTQFKELLIYKPLVNELSGCLTEIATNNKYLQDHQIEAVDFMIKAIYRIFQGRVQIQNDLLLKPLLDAIVKCVCSSVFIDTFTQVTKLKELNETQAFLLDTCTDYFSWYSGNRREEFCIVIRTALLSVFTQWLLSHVSIFRQWSEITMDVVKKVGNIILDFDMHYDTISGEEVYDNCCKIINSFVSILSSLSNVINDKSYIKLAGIVLLQLYLLTLDQNLLSYIKSQQPSKMLLELTNVDNEYVQFNAYRILAAILTEQDIKMLTNPSKIASVFIVFLKNVIDDPSKILRLRSVLRSLKNLVQHDDIKGEFAKQTDGISLLIRCAIEPQFAPRQVQLDAFEIIMSLAFNDKIGTWLRENNVFVQHLRTLTCNSNTPHLQKAADGILWLLFSKYNKTEQEFKYDVMISYSHKDKDICHRIYQALIANKFRVWIDLEGMHGAMMQVMADAVENSRCILICMSESYHLSPYCQSEAQYGFEKKRVLIPLRVQSGYKADGWLGFLTSGRIYVDFTKMDFDTAYNKIVSEMVRSKVNTKGSSAAVSQSYVSKAETIKPQILSQQLNSDTDQFKGERRRNYTETDDSILSAQSNIASLQKQVALMSNQLEKVIGLICLIAE